MPDYQTIIQIVIIITLLKQYELKSNSEYQRATERELRPTSIRQWREDGKTAAARESFTRNTAKIWNQAPKAIKDALTLNSVKKLAKVYCKTLPI